MSQGIRCNWSEIHADRARLKNNILKLFYSYLRFLDNLKTEKNKADS